MDQQTIENKNASQAQKKHFKFASIWVRIAAAIIDGLIYIPFAILAMYNFITFKSFGLDLLIKVLPFFYKPLMEWKYGATLGKKVVKLRVVSTTSIQISLDQAMARFAPFFFYLGVIILSNYYLFGDPAFMEATDLKAIAELEPDERFSGMSSFAFFITIFSVLYMVTNPFHQGLHDKLARTYCIHHS